MMIMGQEPLNQADRAIYNSDEVLSFGFLVPEDLPVPEPTTCRFCGKRLCYEAIVMGGAVRAVSYTHLEREQTTIRLPAELKERLQREADRFGMSFNGYLLWLIDKAHQDQP